MRHFLTYAGKPTTDFEAYISGAGTFDAPERDITSVTIPGRNGELTLDNGRFKNIKVKYPSFIAKDFRANSEAIRNYFLSLTGYQRLEDTYHPEEYRLARYTGGFSSGATKGMKAGSFELVFDCMPQRWLKSGERSISIASSGTIINPTMMTAKPLMLINATGSYAIGSIRIKVNAIPMYIDCELQEAYNAQGVSKNSYLTLTDGVFPELAPGENTVSGSMIITPRWWRL